MGEYDPDTDDVVDVEGEAAKIIVSLKPRTKAPEPPKEETFSMDDDLNSTPEQKIKKLQASITAAIQMSHNRTFPETVRKKLLEKVKVYEKEIEQLKKPI